MPQAVHAQPHPVTDVTSSSSLLTLTMTITPHHVLLMLTTSLCPGHHCSTIARPATTYQPLLWLCHRLIMSAVIVVIVPKSTILNGHDNDHQPPLQSTDIDDLSTFKASLYYHHEASSPLARPCHDLATDCLHQPPSLS